MIEFSHVIDDVEGLHARPVVQICTSARAFESTVTVYAGERSSVATDLVGLMALDARKGDMLRVVVEGSDELACSDALREVFTF